MRRRLSLKRRSISHWSSLIEELGEQKGGIDDGDLDVGMSHGIFDSGKEDAYSSNPYYDQPQDR